MELNFLIAIISLVFSIISIIFWFMKFGIGITQEFSERPDVLERRDKIQQSLRQELIEEWGSMKLDFGTDTQIGEEELATFLQFGINASMCSFPTILIEEISGFTERMLTNFLFFVIGVIAVAFSYYLGPLDIWLLSQDLQDSILFGVIILSLFLIYLSIQSMRKMIPAIIKIRQVFFKLTEETKLEEVNDLYDSLRDKGLI